MNNSYLFIALLLLLALMLTFFFPPIPALADDHCWIESAWADCNDSNLFNGYWWRGEGFVPGMITRETHFLAAPPYTMGMAVYYAEGLMEATAHYRGLDLSDYVDGVAMMSCADIGQTVWIRRYRHQWLLPDYPDANERFDWEGPFLVVDCAEWDDHYAIAVFREEVIEVGWKTAQRWGMAQPGAWNEWTQGVRVFKSRTKPPERVMPGVYWYPDWFEEVARFYNFRSNALPNRPIFTMRSEKLLWFTQGGEIRKSYLAWQDNPMYIEPWIRDLIYRIGD